ncbi:MAG TPA: response regulator [Anaerolineae bacterium]|nr:response regulator [Anaerolineae bacterium]HQK14074.1 response regulator [Anaerolineae bacterium]
MTEFAAQQKPQAATLRVIIVDDAEETRRSLQMMLSLVPNSQVVALGTNGREAIMLAQQYHPHIALIDINMPEVDGLTAIQTIHRNQPDIICIIISAEKDPVTLQRAVAVGAQGYLIKPVTAEELLSVMERASKAALASQTAAAQAQPRKPEPSLEELAAAYAKTRRADDEALAVFETLARQPDCKLRWLMTLAMMYIVRRQWSKLKALAERLERRANIRR